MRRVSMNPTGRPSLSQLSLGVALAVFALPVAAQAQSVNYAELQEMFGEPVTTSVTGKPQRASEAPADLVIITRDDIRRSPASDIPGLIQAYAGIDVVRWTAGQSDVSIRGGVQAFDPRLLVLVNGRQVYLDHYGMTNWAGIGVQLSEIQQIEIVRGPNSALFGFNAVSGVINIITINPLQTQQLVSTLEAGNDGYLLLSQSAAIKLGDRVGLRLSGGYEKSDELAGLNASPLAPRVSVGVLNPSHFEAAGELNARIGDGTDAGLSASYTDSRHLDVPPTVFTVPAYYKFISVGGHVAHDTGWGVVSARTLRNWSAIDVPIANIPDSIKFRNKVFVISADVLLRAGTSDTLRLGLEYRQNQLWSSPGYPGATRYEVYAGNAMWEHRLSEMLTFTIAGRIDHLGLELEGEVNQPTIFTTQDFNRSFTAFSFNSALRLKLNNASSLRIVASRGIQAPSLISFGARFDVPVPGVPFPVVTSGNPAIAPARISSAEIGFIHSFEAMSSRLELTVFYNRTNDVMSLSTAVTPPRAAPPDYPFVLTTADNVGSFRAYGLEASLTGRFGRTWLWTLNYSWTKAHQDIVGNAGGQFQRPLALDSATPRHKVKAQLSYEHGPWLATIAGRYTSHIRQLVAIDPTSSLPLSLIDIDAGLALDAKLALKISGRLTITVAGENLTNAPEVGLSPVPAERRLRAGLQVRF
jgi:iron complex outermembrane receptor protein